MTAKCVITGYDNKGRSCIVSAGAVPNSQPFIHTPGFSAALFWKTAADAPVGQPVGNPLQGGVSAIPEQNETCAMLVTFPPESDIELTVEQAQAAAEEMEERLPGFLKYFEQANPGFHTTNTIDYGVVLEGSMELLLDDETTQLNVGDVIVQNGTRHAWRNRGKSSAKMLFVMVGAERETKE